MQDSDSGAQAGTSGGQTHNNRSYSISNNSNHEKHVKFPIVVIPVVNPPNSLDRSRSSSNSSLSSTNSNSNWNRRGRAKYYSMSHPGPNPNQNPQSSGDGSAAGVPGVPKIEEILDTLDNLPPVKPIRLSFIQKILISSGHVMNDLCASLWFTYGLLYLKKVAEGGTDGGKGQSYAAIALTVGQFVDGIATPIVGYEADHFTRCCLCDRNYGRFKSWHLIGSILVLLSFPFIYSPCIGCMDDTSNLAKFFYYTSFITVFQIGWATVQVSHLALIPKMHPDELVRTDLFSKRYGFTVIANIIVFLLTWLILEKSHADPDNCKIDENAEYRFMAIGLVAIGIGAVFTALFQIFVKENSDHEVKDNLAIITTKKQLIRRLSSSPGIYDPDQMVGIPSCTPTPRRRGRAGSTSSRNSRIIIDEGRNGVIEIYDGGSAGGTGRVQTASNRTVESVEDLDLLLAGNEADALGIQEHPQLSTVSLNPGKHKMGIKDWFTLPQFYVASLVYMCTRLSVNLGQVYMPLYVQDSLKLPCNTVATVPLTMYISGFIVSIGIKFLNKILGRQVAYTVGASLSISAACLILLLPWHQPPNEDIYKNYIIYVVGALLGGGSSAILVTSLSITADIIGSNIESGAFVYGCMSFTDKVSCGLAILTIDHLLPCDAGDNEGASPKCKDQNGDYYQKVLGFTTGGSAIIGIFGVLLLTLLIRIQNHRLGLMGPDQMPGGDACIQEFPEDLDEDEPQAQYRSQPRDQDHQRDRLVKT